jgi:hypothetical protein
MATEELTSEDRADICVQVMTALTDAICASVKGLAVRVTNDEKLLLVAYFDRIPLHFEYQLLSDANAEAAYSLYRLKLEPEIRCVVTQRKMFEIVNAKATNIKTFEEENFGASVFRYWIYVRHGESPGDEEDLEDNSPLGEDEFCVLE